MIKLSKEELQEEINAVKNVLKIHKEQIKLNEKGVKANGFILQLLEAELETFK